MRLSARAGLIPRNNWDYGLGALTSALGGLRSAVNSSPSADGIFGRSAVWTNSGRTSLYAILRALDLPAGARVGVPLYCCSVVANAISQAGLIPRYLDSNPDDGNISLADLAAKRSELAAIVAVHMFGNPCEMDGVNAAAAGLPVIEDCAQSLFSTYRGRLTGTLSTASFFSFRCGKYVSAGEGSAILTAEEELRARIEGVVASFPAWSTTAMAVDAAATFAKAALYNRPWYGLFGYPVGTRLDRRLNLTAKDGFEPRRVAPTHLALINKRLSHFEGLISVQEKHAHMLLEGLRPVGYTLPRTGDDRRSNWYQFPLRFDDPDRREAMADYLFSVGIDTARYLDGAADEARLDYGYAGDCPNAELLSKTILLVPIHYTLSDEDMRRIIGSVNEGPHKL